MTLPKIDLPTYTVNLPSDNRELKVRPFTVKEEKLLLMAAESGKSADVIDTVKQVINNCIVKGSFDVDKAPFFDVDFLFIFLRAKSIGEVVEVNLTCNNTLDDGRRCGHTFPAGMDIQNYELMRNEDITDTIKLTDSSGVKMKYPNYALVKKLDDIPESERKIKVVINSIEHIYDKKGVYSSKDYSTKELQDFVEGLTEAHYKKLENFIDNRSEEHTSELQSH